MADCNITHRPRAGKVIVLVIGLMVAAIIGMNHFASFANTCLRHTASELTVSEIESCKSWGLIVGFSIR